MREERRGKVVSGLALQSNSANKSVSSIPAKYETILFKGPRERKGFGSEDRRFTDPDHDLPGPGSYSRASTMEFKHDSIGKKGFGSMVSSSGRFQDQRVRYTGPGPADYRSRITLNAASDFNRAAATSAFQPTSTVSLQHADGDSGATPGPGAYSATETRHGERLGFDNATGARSAFKTYERKLELVGNPDAPPPTAYQLADLWEGKSYRGNGSCASSSFAPRSHISHSDAAHSIVFQEAGNSDSKPDAGPGPGSYEVQSFGTISSSLAKSAGRASSFFKQSEFVDKTGRPLDPARASSAGPGPGTYYVDPATTAGDPVGGQRPGVSAPFVSRSAGHTQTANELPHDAPGPAYYTKTLPPKHKSFHLNAQKHYVTRA